MICKLCRKNRSSKDFIREDYPKQKSRKYTSSCKYCRAKKRQQRANLQFYPILFEIQNGCCAICGRRESQFKQKLAVDHDHKTGIIRGLLCDRCNIAVGIHQGLKSQIEKYLETVPQRMVKIYKELLDERKSFSKKDS